MQITVTVIQTIDIPQGASIYTAPSGRDTAFRLADGRIVRPQITYEIEEDDGAGEEAYHDLGHDELTALGIDVGDFVEVNVEED